MTMQTETIRLEELKHATYNPRIMTTSQTQKLQKNLETFGLVDPIIINTKNKHIIGGHQRYHILQEKYTDKELHLIRLGDIGWVFTEDTLTVEDENHEKALNLALNRLSGEFDDGKVQELMEDLTEQHLDMDLTGFEDYEITEYLLDSYDTDILEEEEPDKDEDLLNFEDSADEDIHSTTIKFHNQKQRETFIQLLDKLQEKDTKNHTPAQLLTEYMNNHYIPSNEKIPPYTLLFQNQEEKERYETILERIEESTNYHRTPLQGFVDENAI